MPQKNKPAPAPSSTDSGWRQLSWDDLEAWAGASSLRKGRQYQRGHRVRGLARGDNETLLAWVQGTERYATQVELRDGTGKETCLFSRCTCPLQISGCKHAVAVVVQYLEDLKSGTAVPAVAPSDERLTLLDAPRVAPSYSLGEDDEEWEDEDEEQPSRTAVSSKKGAGLRSFLESWSENELVSYILELAAEYPEVKRRLTTRAALECGDATELIAQTKAEVARVTSEQSWYNHWQHEGHLPSYSDLRQRLQRLLELGQMDALLSLGETLFEAGMRQVGSSDDEGHSASELASCMEIVFQAVLPSSRSDVEKLMFVIDRLLEDPFDLCPGADVVLEADWPVAAWSAAADELLRRLHSLPVPNANDFSSSYDRQRLANRAIECLRQAGREAEVIPLCEAEAPRTNSYERLLRELLAVRRFEDAKRWAREGIERTAQRWPGIAGSLQRQLEEIATAEKDWPTLLTLRTEDFTRHPSVSSLEELLTAAKKTSNAEAVRTAALHFLETGAWPQATASVPARPAPRGRKPKPPPVAHPHARPHFDVLLDLAIHEKRLDDVLHWYDRMSADRAYGASYRAAQVADAVATSHPDRALALYQSVIEADVARTSPSAYESALPYLRKVRDLLHKQKRAADWTAYLASLRERHRRKSRFMEVLDRVAGRRIVES